MKLQMYIHDPMAWERISMEFDKFVKEMREQEIERIKQLQEELEEAESCAKFRRRWQSLCLSSSWSLFSSSSSCALSEEDYFRRALWHNTFKENIFTFSVRLPTIFQHFPSIRR